MTTSEKTCDCPPECDCGVIWVPCWHVPICGEVQDGYEPAAHCSCTCHEADAGGTT